MTQTGYERWVCRIFFSCLIFSLATASILSLNAMPGLFWARAHMRLWNLEAIEAAFSNAAVNPTAWTHALNVVTAETEAFGSVLLPVAGNHPPNVPFSDRMEASYQAYFQGGCTSRMSETGVSPS